MNMSLGANWDQWDDYPCPSTFEGGIVANVPFDLDHPHGHVIGPLDFPMRVRIVARDISGKSPLLGVIEMPNGTRSTEVWHLDGTHRGGDPMACLRNCENPK